ncbi:dol-P-Man:Man(5)GlcNAc(2)-PP-Dol alpha-1,3-mannosyltransferase [Centruroides vittatus]|uniref:dol-P-Man:Man(5)GlcNAc(2)-PP-Dol alpha-1,3-mannosyltransferase n=1 Tax=Centruroides vittatus TaxID=120091 RepID=UPI00350F27B7
MSKKSLQKAKTKLWRIIKKEFAEKNLILNPNYLWIAAIILILAEIIVNVIIITKVPYTEIDWKAYMQEVEGVINGTFDYTKLKGDTGPLVYPAGFVAIFTIFYYFTEYGREILTAQYLYMFLYLLTVIMVFRIYIKNKKIPPYALIFMCCTSYRIHSIYVLRLFNDPIAMLLLYAAVNCFIANKWSLGCTFYSLAVSVKMNILLFAPGLLILLLRTNGLHGTIWNLLLCAFIQIILGLPFLLTNPFGYILGAFNLGRVFLYEWTVNWRFLPENIFLNKYFHISLLLMHIIVVVLFCYKWIKYNDINLWSKTKNETELSVDQILWPLFISNFIGIAFSRSLHYQFYVWYFHTLPYLLWSTTLLPVSKLCILGAIELAWNTYPSTDFSSLLLHICHAIILVKLWTNLPEKSKIA